MARLLMLACLLPLAFGADYSGGVAAADGIAVPSLGALTPPGGSFAFAPVRSNPEFVVTGYGTLLGGAQPFSGLDSGISRHPSSPFSGVASGFPGRFGFDSGFAGLNAGPPGLANGPNFGFNGPQSGFPGPQSAFVGGYPGPSSDGFRLGSGLESAYSVPPGLSGPTVFRQINFNGPNSGYGPLNSALIGRNAEPSGFTVGSAFAPEQTYAAFAPLSPVANSGHPSPFGVRSPFAAVGAAASAANVATSTVNYVGRGHV